MKALIIEDEKAAVRNLQALLKEVAPSTEVIDTLDSVTESVAWFESHAAPDVVFMDIHLADGSAFEIFEHVRIADGVTKAVVSDRERYVLPNTLDELTDSLDPARFFRVNRQYLISRGAVQDIDLWFNNRLAINLKVPTDGKILVSKLRVNDFKNWFSGS